MTIDSYCHQRICQPLIIIMTKIYPMIKLFRNINHQIHHLENTENIRFSKEQLHNQLAK